MRKLNNVMGLCIALMMSSMAFAKGQVKSTVISSDYSRNSISKITILYGDRWDNQVVTGVDSIQTGAKFDINNRQVLSCLENIARRKEIWQVNYMASA